MSPLARTIAVLAAGAALACAQTLTVATTALPEAVAGTAYSYTLTATGGTPPYSWRFPLGELVPPFLSLSSSGVLSGTPLPAEAGNSYSFRVQVADASERIALAALKLTVRGATAPPLSITTASLPAGRVGTPYAQTLAASGGTPPYTWAVVSGDLPPGLRLAASSAALEGTPSLSGEFAFTVQVTEAAGASAAKTFRLAVAGSGADVFPAGPQPGAGAPVAVAVDSARRRVYAVHRAVYGDLQINAGYLPTDQVSVVDAAERRVLATIGVGQASQGDGAAIAVDSARGRVYVSNADDGTLSVIDSSANAVVQTIAVGAGPQGVDVEPASGTVYVANSAGRSVSVLSPAGTLLGTVPLDGGARAVAVDRATRRAYVLVAAQPWTVVALEGAAKRSETPLPLLSTVKSIAIDPRSRAYVSDHNTGMVAVLDLTGDAPRELTRWYAGAYPDALAVDPATHQLLVAHWSENLVSVFQPDGTRAAAVEVLRGPSAIAVDESSRQAYVAAALSDSLSLFDLRDRAASAIPLGTLPTGLALDSAAGRLYAANFAADAVSVLEAATGAWVASWPCGAGPWALAVDATLRQVYTLNASENALGILDAATGALRKKIRLGPTEAGVVAASPSTHRVYVTSGSSNHNYLTVLDGETGSLLASVPVGQRPVGIALDEAAGRVYVASQQSGAISVVDTASYRVTETWRPAAGNVWGLALDTGLRQLYVTVPPNLIGDFSGLQVLDTATGQVKALIRTGSQPEMVAVNPRNGLVFVSDSYDATVTIIDGASLRVLAVRATGNGPRDLALDPSSGAAYVGNVFDGTIQRLPETP